jgi:hypothetical protein
MPHALTLWSLAVLVVGGLMYLAMSMSTRSPTSTRALATRRPGWIARRRARNGIAHPRGRVGVRYRSGLNAVHLSDRELAHHGALFGGPGSGKALALDTLVPTPYGWATMGEVEVGDVVFDERGQPTRVMFVSDVQFGRPCYEIEFSDGSTIVADAEHRWLTYTDRARKSVYRASLPKRGSGQGSGQQDKRALPEVRSTADIVESLWRTGGANHSIPVAAALELPEAILPSDPYVFGLWLGDGTTTNGSLTTADQEIVDNVAIAGYRVTTRSAPLLYGVLDLEHQLRGMGLIAGYSKARLRQRGIKRIPLPFQRSAVDQRLALLQGLMDTDGHCDPWGSCEFSVTSEHLASDVFDLVCLLGIKATLRQMPCRGRTEASSIAYTVAFTTSLPVFRLQRKALRQRSMVRATQQHRYIVDVRPVASVPVRCIAVEAPSHLFLASRACIPTHNTTFLQLLVEASAGQQPVVIVDPKGSPALVDTVRAHGGQVWTLDGRLPAELLDPRPWQVPDLLLEAEDYSADARAYRDAAHQRAQWAAWALALNNEPMDLAKLPGLLDRAALMRALEPHRGRDARINDWLHRLEHQHGGIEDSGARGLDRALGTLLDGVAMRGSLRACAEALRLDDVLATRGLVLFSLDVADYPHATRKVASWVLLGMGRIARQLSELSAEPEPASGSRSDRAGGRGLRDRLSLVERWKPLASWRP